MDFACPHCYGRGFWFVWKPPVVGGHGHGPLEHRRCSRCDGTGGIGADRRTDNRYPAALEWLCGAVPPAKPFRLNNHKYVVDPVGQWIIWKREAENSACTWQHALQAEIIQAWEMFALAEEGL